MVDDVLTCHTQALGDQLHIGLVQGAASTQRRRGKRQACALALNVDQAYAALLHHLLRFGHTAGFQPCMAGAQGGVTGEREFPPGAKNPHRVVGLRVGGRQHEGGFRQIGPVGEGLHVRSAQARSIHHHRQRVAKVWHSGEHIDLGK